MKLKKQNEMSLSQSPRIFSLYTWTFPAVVPFVSINLKAVQNAHKTSSPVAKQTVLAMCFCHGFPGRMILRRVSMEVIVMIVSKLVYLLFHLSTGPKQPIYTVVK